jgi:peptide/nickel transport system ATP-binding protein/oligopeptide transport system ATP-binding protein
MDQTQDHEFGSRAAIVCLGKIIETGATEEMFERPLHPYSRALLSSVLYPDPAQKPPRFVLSGEIPSPIDGHLRPRCPLAVGACQHACPSLATGSRGRAAAPFCTSEMA